MLKYQEEGAIKFLKDIRDSLAGGITPRTLGGKRASRSPGLDGSDDDDDDDNDDDDDDDDDDGDEQKRLSKLLRELRTNEDNKEFRKKPKKDKLNKFVNDNDNNMPDLETEKKAVKTNILNKINNFDEMVRNKKIKLTKCLKIKKID